MIKASAIIFDMDGLLLDSERVGVEIWEKIQQDHNLQPEDDFWQNLIGKRTQEITPLFEVVFPDHDVNAIRQSFSDYLSLYIKEKAVPVKQGAIELIQYLNTHNIPWGIGTGSHRKKTKLLLTQADIPFSEDFLVCGDEVVAGKPHPETFLAVAKKLNTPPEECLVLEDSKAGLQAALAANMHVYHIPDLQVVPVPLIEQAHGSFETLEIFLTEFEKARSMEVRV